MMMKTTMQRAAIRRIFLAAAIACLGISSSASADLVVYATTAQGGFGLLDLDTGVFTATGSTYTIGTNPYGVTGPLTTTAITGLDRDQVSAVAAGAIAAVPEPATLAGGGLGILLIACGAWRRGRPVD
jgi:hypothetical protein